MRIINNDTGRSHQMLVADEVAPIEGYYIPDVIRLVSGRYNFSQFPSADDVRTKGAIFRNGQLISGTQKINITELGFLNDGIYATAQDTTKADFIVDDLITWAEQAIGLRPPLTNIPRKYDNSVVVEFDAHIEKSLGIFDEVIQSYNEALSILYAQAISTSFYRIDFAFDPTDVNLMVNTRFTIERRLRSPFSSNRYYCTAPLKTEMHINLLEKFERAIN